VASAGVCSKNVKNQRSKQGRKNINTHEPPNHNIIYNHNINRNIKKKTIARHCRAFKPASPEKCLDQQDLYACATNERRIKLLTRSFMFYSNDSKLTNQLTNWILYICHFFLNSPYFLNSLLPNSHFSNS